jgi:ABC-type antimicrobial peptide transport system permease subunit
VIVRPSNNGRDLADALHQAALKVGPRVLVGRVRSGSDWLGQSIVEPRQRTILLGLLGGLGILLALVGVFGMTAYAVVRRTREIGVRLAFGARPDQVVRTILADVVLSTGMGLLVGLGASVLTTRIIASFLFKTTPTDPMTLAAVALALGLSAVLAGWLPARRAARVNPVEALRAD